MHRRTMMHRVVRSLRQSGKCCDSVWFATTTGRPVVRNYNQFSRAFVQTNSCSSTRLLQRQLFRLQPSVACRILSTISLPPHEVAGMPALSPTMETGNIVRWNKKEGDMISAGDVICEVETDKATVDYEAQDDGFLAKILVSEGSADVAVGQPICIIVQDESDIGAFAEYSTGVASASRDAPATPSKENTQAAPKAPTPPPSASVAVMSSASSRVFASPIARKFAREAGISVVSIPGTGPGGRVILHDVQEAISRGSSVPFSAASSADDVFQDVAVSTYAKLLSEQLMVQKQEAPHFHLTIDLSLDKLLEVRKDLNCGVGEDELISVNDFLIRAAALAVKRVPEVNAAWMGNFIRQYHNTNVSLMVSAGGGTISPVIRDVNSKSLSTIASDIRELVSKVGSGAVSNSDMTGGTLTISNVGMYGVKTLSAIVSPQQACSLGIGNIEKRIVPNDDVNADQIYKQSTVVSVTMACDHRVIDGAVGARYLAAYKELVENPYKILL